MEEIEHKYTEEIVCPHCGEENSDSWEYYQDSGKIDCYKCGGKFLFQREIEISYTTQKCE